MDGGVGDHMASLVAIKYIKSQYPYVEPLVWTPDYLTAFSAHVLPGIEVRSYTEMKTQYNKDLYTKTTKWDSIISPMKIHLLDYAFLKLCDENPDITYKNSLRIYPDAIDTSMLAMPKDYAVVTAGFTAKAREFRAPYINEICKYLVSRNVTPVFLGATKTETGAKHIIEGNFSGDINFKLGVNLLNRTSLLQAAKIMGNAKAVLGVDNGLLHVAGYTNVAIIGGFPSVSPEIRMPVRNNILGYNYYPVVPDEGKGCNFCQERTNFLYGHDYRECIYKDDRAINQMTAEKFINKLEIVL